MQHDVTVELLARAPLFRGLGGELLGKLSRGGTLLRFRAEQPIASAGLAADAALFFISGSAKLQDRTGRDLGQNVGPGSMLCEMAMLVETSHVHGAVALDDVTILSISRETIGRLMAVEPALADILTRNIRHNLAVTAEKLRELDRQLSEPIGNFLIPDDAGDAAGPVGDVPGNSSKA